MSETAPAVTAKERAVGRDRRLAALFLYTPGRALPPGAERLGGTETAR